MKRTRLTLALAGNPNSGKTTLFNALTGSRQYVGNWPGVTVEKKEGPLRQAPGALLVDLPGVYSLAPWSPEERAARDYLYNERPDAIINIVDGTALERSLYLTTQLLELNIPLVLAVNMMDEVEKSGLTIDLEALGARLGCRVVAISALTKRGLSALVATALSAAREKRPAARPDLGAGAAARYDFIAEILRGCLGRSRRERTSVTERIDRIVTQRFLALPIFFLIMFLVYYLSVSSLGVLLTRWTVNTLFGEGLLGPPVRALLVRWDAQPWLTALLVNGVLGGVGAVLGFLPQMLVLFFCLALLEAGGYMARVAFIMDRIFRQFGLSGKSFIPILVGTGCSVPGILASRAIENPMERKITVITTSFIPCGAKLPMIALFSGALFGGVWWVAPLAYFTGAAAILCSGIILKKSRLFRGEPSPFIMELPPYRLPSLPSLLRIVWDRGWSFVRRAGTLILLSSVLVWFLSSMGLNAGQLALTPMEDSLLAALGRALAPFFRPLGWAGWQAAAATVTGLAAKENVVSTLGILLGDTASPLPLAGYFSTASGWSFVLFNLLCAPCMAAVAAIRRELGSFLWTLFAVLYQTALAWGVSFWVYQFLRLAQSGRPDAASFAAVLTACGFLFLLLRDGGETSNDS